MLSYTEDTICNLLYFPLLPGHPEDAVIGVGTTATAEATAATTAATNAAPAALAGYGATLERGAQLRRPLTTSVAPVATPLELAWSGLRLVLRLEIGLGSGLGLGLTPLDFTPRVAQLQQPRTARLACCAPVQPVRHHTHLHVCYLVITPISRGGHHVTGSTE
eukprot:scaffold21045_cov59-Phaeocystis_antarctica.AAC.5